MKAGDRVTVTGEVKAVREGPDGPYAIVQLPAGLTTVLVRDASPIDRRTHNITDTDLRPDRSLFARTLRILRKRDNLSQLDLAKRLNVTQYAVSGWESGRCLPRTARLAALAGVFDVTVGDLLGEPHEVHRRDPNSHFSRTYSGDPT